MKLLREGETCHGIRSVARTNPYLRDNACMDSAAGVEQTVGDVGEFGLIDLIRQGIGTSKYVLIGPGDDAAQVATNETNFLVSTDLLVEGRHFRRDWSSAYEVGRKAAACNLSDINAMGGVATALTIGFGAPADLPVSWVVDLVKGFEEECAKVGAHIVGGDVTSSDKIVIAVTAMGDAVRPVRRDGALPGDVVAYAGQLGLAGAGFAALSRGFRSPRAAVEAHRIPQPPYAAGPQAANVGATSITNVSDGLLADLGHIAEASGVSIDLASSSFVVWNRGDRRRGARCRRHDLRPHRRPCLALSTLMSWRRCRNLRWTRRR